MHEQVGSPPTGLPGTQVITFTLDQAHDLDGAYIWNYTHATLGAFFAARQARTFDIGVSSDGVTYTSLGNFAPPAAPGPGFAASQPTRLLTFTASNVTHVQFSSFTNYGGGNFEVGLNDVRFSSTSEL